MQTAATEFPAVGGQAALRSGYMDGDLISEESIMGSFGECFRSGAGVGCRIKDCLGLEMGINYYNSNDKAMVKRGANWVCAQLLRFILIIEMA